MLKKTIIAGGALLLLFLFLVTGELAGRYYGLTSFPLYQASEAYEYIHIPNQKVRIYGKWYETNEFSMRSKPLLPTDTTVVLLIGDSIINGGNATDHDSLASSILEERLSRYFSGRVRVLNIAESSWGPDNAAAYIKEHGIFNADLILLVFSSADAFDNMEHKPIVGIHSQYPDKQAYLAWEKIIEKGTGRIKYFFGIKSNNQTESREGKAFTEEIFSTGFQDFKTLSDTTSVPLHFYLHAGVKEIIAKKREDSGDLIIDFCQKNNIPYTIELDKSVDQSHYMDKIHFNDKGQKFLADNLFPLIVTELSREPGLALRQGNE